MSNANSRISITRLLISAYWFRLKDINKNLSICPYVNKCNNFARYHYYHYVHRL